MQSDLKSKLTQLVNVLYKVFLYGITYIKAFRVWSKSWSKLLNNSLLKLIMFTGRESEVVLYRADKNWIYFVESVTSVGPMDPKRIKEIEEMTANVTAGKIYVTAFLDFKTFKQFSESLAWETEVWIADMPDHMIHLNGDKFLGPRK